MKRTSVVKTAGSGIETVISMSETSKLAKELIDYLKLKKLKYIEMKMILKAAEELLDYRIIQ